MLRDPIKRTIGGMLSALLLCVTTGAVFTKILAADSTIVVHQPIKTAAPVSPLNTIVGTPDRIIIPALSIDNRTEAGVYNPTNHSWNLSTVNAQYAQISAQANLRGGNTFIYGHNSRRIFARLPNVKKGDVAIIETKNNLKFFYGFSSMSEVGPDDVEALDYNGAPILTVQTCSGNWNEKRQVFRFDLLRAEISNPVTTL